MPNEVARRTHVTLIAVGDVERVARGEGMRIPQRSLRILQSRRGRWIMLVGMVGLAADCVHLIIKASDAHDMAGALFWGAQLALMAWAIVLWVRWMSRVQPDRR